MKGQIKKMLNNIPLIDNYADFVSLNEELKNKPDTKAINFRKIYLDSNRVRLKGQSKFVDLDELLHNFVVNQEYYVSANIDLLNSYDFTRLLSLTHPEEFKDRLYAYAQNLLLVGSNEFTLWDFNMQISSYNGVLALELAEYDGDKERRYLRIPYGITSLGKYAFYNCYALERVELPSTLKIIGEGAFLHSNIEEIKIPDTVEVIKSEAFSSCKNLKRIYLPSGLKEIQDRAFENTLLEDVQIPDTVTYLGNECFSGCTCLRKVNIPKELEMMGPSNFEGTPLILKTPLVMQAILGKRPLPILNPNYIDKLRGMVLEV